MTATQRESWRFWLSTNKRFLARDQNLRTFMDTPLALDDLGLNVALFRSPHVEDANTAAAWADLPRLADDITRLAHAG